MTGWHSMMQPIAGPRQLIDLSPFATSLSEVKQGMTVFGEETFGPIAAIARVPDADAAVKAAMV
jgi:hypothetical protein